MIVVLFCRSLKGLFIKRFILWLNRDLYCKNISNAFQLPQKNMEHSKFA